MKPRYLELYVSELVLHGFSPSDGYRISEVAERELVRLFTEGDVAPPLAQGGEIARLDGGTFALATGAKPDAIGAPVARALYGGLQR